MSGHVFHPGHEELHGVTVVVESPSGVIWVGRYHERTDRGVLLHDVATHDPASADQSRDAWIQRLIKFGIRIDQKHLIWSSRPPKRPESSADGMEARRSVVKRP